MTQPTDPLYSTQWHLNMLGDIQTIWSEYTGAGITVGVYDDGVEKSHSDLSANYDSSLHFSLNGKTYIGLPYYDNQKDYRFFWNGFYDELSEVITANGDNHGTAVAGIIAAAANGEGVVGVAFGATLSSVPILTYPFLSVNSDSDAAVDAKDALTIKAIEYASHLDVMNNSWGYTPEFDAGQDARDPTTIAAKTITAFDYATTHGRGGLGTVITLAAGNENANANGDGLNGSRFVINVTALDAGGGIKNYSNYGASVFVSAGAASVTTDREYSDGYNYNGLSGETSNRDYTKTFGGTSAATPVVSGVAALMLDANAGLGWRDVQQIFTLSSAVTGPVPGSVSYFEIDGTHFQTITDISGGDTWNDGGRAYSADYGFGAVDAFAAVRMAEVWSIMNGAAHTSANELSVAQAQSVAVTTTMTGAQTEDPKTVLGSSVTFVDDFWIEHATVDISWTMTAATTLENPDYLYNNILLYIVAPDGSEFYIDKDYWRDYSTTVTASFDWRYGLSHSYGMNAVGEWTASLRLDPAGSNLADVTLEISNFGLTFFGAEWDVDNIHTITNDYALAATHDTAAIRDGVITDTNGGNDWLNMAAIAKDVLVDVSAGGGFSVNGIEWGTIDENSVIEGVITGDGNDTLIGSNGSDSLYGMRGADFLNGGGGDDLLYGGAGFDALDLRNGVDGIILTLAANGVIDFGAGNDTLIGIEAILLGAGNDSLTAGEIGYWLDGGAGDDTLRGGAGKDIFIDGAGNDVIVGGSGEDFFYIMTSGKQTFNLTTGIAAIATGNDTVSGIEGVQFGAGNDSVLGSATAELMAAGSGNDSLLGNSGNDTLRGETGHDLMYGGSGLDVLTGGDQNDRLYGGASFDKLYGGTGHDVLAGDTSIDLLYGGTGNDRLYGGTGSDQLFGGDGKDSVYGGDTADGLYGGDSSDSLYGGSGNDSAYGGDFFDRIYAGTGHDALYGGNLIDSLYGDDGNDQLFGGDYNDSLYGGDGNDRLYGGEDDDRLYGGDGNDKLYGGDEYDRLYGGAGKDVLYAGSDDDQLFGGSGADVFYFSKQSDGANNHNYDQVTVHDFADNVDTAYLSKALWGGKSMSVEDVLWEYNVVLRDQNGKEYTGLYFDGYGEIGFLGISDLQDLFNDIVIY